MRMPERLPPTEISNSLSLQELWDKIQLSHGRMPLLSFATCPPKHNGNLPELPNDVRQQKKKSDVNEMQSSACNPGPIIVTNQHLRSDLLRLPSCQSSFPSRRTVCSQQLMRHRYDARLVSVPNLTPCMPPTPLAEWLKSQYDPRQGSFPILSSRMPWASDPGIDFAYLPTQHHAPHRRSLGKSQMNHQPDPPPNLTPCMPPTPLAEWLKSRYDPRQGSFPILSSRMPWASDPGIDFAYLPTQHHAPHRRSLGKSQTNHQPDPPSFPHHALNDTKRFFDCVVRRELRPILSETVTLQDKMHYRRDCRNLSNELQGQCKTSMIGDGKKSLSVIKWKQFKRKWEEGLHVNCDHSMLLLERLQPVDVRPSTTSLLTCTLRGLHVSSQHYPSTCNCRYFTSGSTIERMCGESNSKRSGMEMWLNGSSSNGSGRKGCTSSVIVQCCCQRSYNQK
jgi:hypothetical protein